MRFLVLLLAVVCTSAAAQSVLYRPLEIGNEWVYQHDAVSSSTSSTACSNLTLQSYIRARVLRDTTLNGRAARVVACTTYDQVGGATQEGTYVADVAFGRAYGGDAAGQACNSLLDKNAPFATAQIPNPVVIGGTSYPMGSVGRFSLNEQGGSGGGGQYQIDDRYGDRVGLTSSMRWVYAQAGSGNCSRRLFTLTYAVVGGETFGASPVAGEQVPASAAASSMRAFPVPAQTSVTVEVGVAGAVEVVDALGRLVASGAAAPGRPLALDVSAWPAGVYIARAMGADGSASVRLVVAR